MKVRHDEGVANHIGPEPCVAVRKDVDEASVGEGIGQPLSHEIDNSGRRRCFEGGRQHSQARNRKAWRPGGVGEPGMCRSSLGGNREIPGLAIRECAGPHWEGEEPKPMMHGPGKSDSAIVARKPTNKAGQPAAEPVERRAGAEGNAGQQSTCRAQNRESVSQALERIRHVTVQRMESESFIPARWIGVRAPKARAECPNWARSDLCGGRSAMSGPTAIFHVQNANSSL